MTSEDENEITEDSEDLEEVRYVPARREERLPALLDPLTAYLREIKKYEGLSAEEEHRLAVHYKNTGDPAAAYRLITSNLLLVVQIAMGFKREWQNLMDLIQEGNVGLMQAVKNFDPFRNARLPGYAAWWIKAYILKFILDNWRLVKVGTTNTRRKLLYNLRKEKEKLEREGFTPTSKLLAERFGVDEKEVIDVEAGLGASDVSIDAPLKEDSLMSPAHFLSDGTHPEKEVESRQFREILRGKIAAFSDNLRPMERDILELRALADQPLTLQEIGERYNVTREAARQAEQRLMKKVKDYILETLPEAADYFTFKRRGE